MLTVDDVLLALNLKGWRHEWQDNPRIWHSYCPCCAFRSLVIYDGYERVKLACTKRCEEADILAAFSRGLEPVSVDEALSLGEQIIDVLYRLDELENGSVMRFGGVS